MSGIRYRRRRSARVWEQYSSWNLDIEVGDLLTRNGELFRAEESGSWWTRAAGVLYPRKIKSPRPGMKAEVRDNEVWWIDATPTTETTETND